MEKIDEEKIQLNYYPALELIFAAARLSLDHEFIEEKENGIPLDKDIENWVENSLETMNSEQKEIMDFYFDEDGYLGLGLSKLKEKLSEDCTPVDFITYLEGMNAKRLTYYLLIGGHDGKFEESKLDKLNDFHNIYDWITENFIVTARGRWKIFRILSKPEEVQKELCSFLSYFYNNHFKNFYKKQKVTQFISNYIKKNEELLKDAFLDYTKYILSQEARDIIFNSNNIIKINISYFAGVGDVFVPEQNRFTLGYKYPDKRLPGKEHQILNYSQIFKTLADETRLKMLLELKENPKYLTEISNSINISSPTVKYHLEKFMESGVIEIEKAEKKKYYKLRKDRMIEVLNLIKELFSI